MSEIENAFWSFNWGHDEILIEHQVKDWLGPFSVPGFEERNMLNSVPDIPGIYLFTFDCDDGYIIRLVGLSNSIPKRLKQHRRSYHSGDYTLLNIDMAQNGIRKEIWHGWGYAKKHRNRFLSNRNFYKNCIVNELTEYRLFIAAEENRRIQERIEYSIVQNLYNSKDKYCNLIDRGMMIKGRLNRETPIVITNHCQKIIHGLPPNMYI